MKTSKFWIDRLKKKHPFLMGKYLVQNPFLYFFLKTTDAFFSFFKRERQPIKNFSHRKILLSHTGHLGDVVIATSVLPVLKKAFPTAKIGFVLGSWAEVVLEKHPLIDQVYILDHWKNNRSNKPLWKKIVQYYKSFWRSFRDLRKERYDVAIDLNFHFPNSIFLLACARIARRIGYTSGGFGSLLTDGIDWSYQEHYISGYHKELLKKLGIEELFLQDLKPSLCPVTEKVKMSLKEKLSRDAQEKGYVIIHIGAGLEKKEWLLEKWKGLAKRLSMDGFFLIFTGKGQREKEKIAWVMQDLSNVQSLCDELSWQELVLLIQKAKILISVDTVVTHVAFALGVKTLILFSGMNSMAHWKPPHAKSVFFPLECFPCFDKDCSSRKCLSLVTEDEVFIRAKEMLFSTQPKGNLW